MRITSRCKGKTDKEARAEAKKERTRNGTVRTKGKEGTDDKKQQSAQNCKVGQRMRMQRCSGTTEKAMLSASEDNAQSQLVKTTQSTLL